MKKYLFPSLLCAKKNKDKIQKNAVSLFCHSHFSATHTVFVQVL